MHVIAGGAAGAAASAFTTPLDVIKTLLNTQETGIGLTKGMPEAIKQVWYYFMYKLNFDYTIKVTKQFNMQFFVFFL